ncbi:MAG: YcgL domain-containing protein [Xanthomonadales bacterium]|jgi:uncharacterized protein YcgL (UPF0745 family)|nr:YcgL domain-containing protein [Xanthomonadales bacterium]
MTDSSAVPAPAPCTIWRSRTREYTYIYLREDVELADLPAPLQVVFAEAELAMELDLARRDALANADIATVREQLNDAGYYLQLPPEDDPSGWLDLPPKHP